MMRLTRPDGKCASASLLVLLVLVTMTGCMQPVSDNGSEASDPLPSWGQSASRTAITDFVNRVTDEQSADFVPASERIAVFDNDGTLWAEKPLYFQLLFAIERIKAMAPEHPEWQGQEPFQSVLSGDFEGLAATGMEGLLELIMSTHAGMTAADFETIAKEWIKTARHPSSDRPYTQMVYQPMLEILSYLRANGFKTFIVSGGGIDFMRPWVEGVYGIPPEQVVGTTIQMVFEVTDGEPVLVREPAIDFVDDKEGKPVAIHRHIGRRPIAAFGNSDGDYQMLQWTTSGEGARLGVLVHHTDAEREWAYDRESHVGRLVKGLDDAEANGWTLVDMKQDWKTVFPPVDSN